MRGWEESVERESGGGRESGTSLSSWWRWRGNRTLLYYSSNKTIYTNRGRCHQHSWWLAPLIFHLILYICFYDLPANRNTQRESRSVMVDCAISSAGAGCRERPRESEREREIEKATSPNHKTFPHLRLLVGGFLCKGPPFWLWLRHVIRIICNFGFLLVSLFTRSLIK